MSDIAQDMSQLVSNSRGGKADLVPAMVTLHKSMRANAPKEMDVFMAVMCKAVKHMEAEPYSMADLS
eukprot:10286018-Alexandrium_andersonii.AAC.1